ncbi:hypothetical protein QQF64_031919 [Cirrhinus molitorella]|uniref:Uncharacterized protein n=1 Tax=Cirrhinus molitorella TaxID=172907 RepID=A0ABR3MYC5_9TELE
MQAFPPEHLASGLQDLNFGNESWPAQRSLGLYWDFKTDTFTFKVAVNDRPYTHRKVLSVVKILFDPLGFVVPVTIQGRALVCELTKEVQDWDTVLPEKKKNICLELGHRGIGLYLRALADEGKVKVGFMLGKSKLSPPPDPSIPRLELCGAVLAVEMAEQILDELDQSLML